jgi:hypothetical protein
VQIAPGPELDVLARNGRIFRRQKPVRLEAMASKANKASGSDSTWLYTEQEKQQRVKLLTHVCLQQDPISSKAFSSIPD